MRVKAPLLSCVEALLSEGWRGRGAASLVASLLRLAGPRKTVGLRNLFLAFPDRDERWRRDLLGRVYDHLALSLVEFLVVQKDPDRVLAWFDEVSGLEHFDRALSLGRGVVMLTGHIGNWELLGAWLCRKGYPMYAVVQRNEDAETEALIEASRRRIGLRTLSKSFGMKAALRALKEGAVVALLADQHGGDFPTDFMGHQAMTFSGPAAFSLLSGAPVVPVVSFRKAPFLHGVRVLPPLVPPEGDRKEKVEALTRRANAVLESLIRLHPEQWLWLHRRWRTEEGP